MCFVIFGKQFYYLLFSCRDSVKDYAKLLAELVDNKLARHYELDDSSKKKVAFIFFHLILSGSSLLFLSLSHLPTCSLCALGKDASSANYRRPRV